jgi:hypothetical protein
MSSQRGSSDPARSIYRLLPGNVGYVDLVRLSENQVDSMFRSLASTKAIVFDMRGYPQISFVSLARRLNRHTEPIVAAQLRIPVVPSPDTTRTTFRLFRQMLARDSAPPYTGRTVMLIDGRTISAAEHIGLHLESANGTEFIGTQTAGADGDVTSVALPGNLSIIFTGIDVRHADGRQLQRVGLIPTIRVAPTIAGIRAGRDEVLERAVRYVGGTGEIPVETVKPPPPVVLDLQPEAMPSGWYQISPTNTYRVGVDSSGGQHGGAAGHVTWRGDVGSDQSGSLVQSVRADEYLGKTVRVSAYLRSGYGFGNTYLWARVDGDSGSLAYNSTADEPFLPVAGWVRREVVIEVPPSAVGWTFGIARVGRRGEAWIDDLQVEEVSHDVTSRNLRTPPPDLAPAKGRAAMYAQYPTRPVNLDFAGKP